MQHYDLIIAGGGAAGLSLAYHLLLSPLRNRSILIVDKGLPSSGLYVDPN
jgi:lycopene beta-cyclase